MESWKGKTSKERSYGTPFFTVDLLRLPTIRLVLSGHNAHRIGVLEPLAKTGDMAMILPWLFCGQHQHLCAISAQSK